ncbi:hypothetical protein Tsubulata_040634, partial [Turnera subulata]
ICLVWFDCRSKQICDAWISICFMGCSLLVCKLIVMM